MYDNHSGSMGPAPALAAGEYILWRGKPKKSAYIADKALSMLPIAVIWCIFDFQFLRAALDSGNGGLLLFLLVHMFPVWLWLGNAVTSVIQWRNEEYYLTNQRIILRKGILHPNRQTVFLRNVRTVELHYGLLDRFFGSGDIYINYHRTRRSSSGWFLMNLANPQELRDRIELLALEQVPAGLDEEIY